MDEFDYLFLGPLIIARITAEVTGLQKIQGAPDLDFVAQEKSYSPSASVIYLGDSVATNAGGQGGERKIQSVQQFWSVVLGVTVADSNGDGEEARAEAGPLLGQLINKLTGWQPSPDTKPLARSARQTPAVYHDGFFYYPLIFSTTFVFPRTRTWQPPPAP